MDFTVHVTRLTLAAVAKQARHFANRLARRLIGNAVNDDYGDAIRCAHGYGRVGTPKPAEMAAVT